MSFKLVRLSLEKFLKDNVPNVFFTTDSNFSDIEPITNIYSQDTLDPNNNSETILSGSVSLIGKNVQGTGTLFNSELEVGESIKVDEEIRVVEEIISDLELNVSESFISTGSGFSIVKPSNLEFRLLVDVGNTAYPYTTDIDITGYTISNSIDDVSSVASFDSNESNISLGTKFENLVQRYQINEFGEQLGTPLEIKIDSWCYIKSPHSFINSNTRKHAMENQARFDLWIKVKDDSNRDKLNHIIESIKNSIIENNLKISIYKDEALTDTFGYGYFDLKSLQSEEIIDNDGTMQSYLVSFVLSYWMNYTK